MKWHLWTFLIIQRFWREKVLLEIPKEGRTKQKERRCYTLWDQETVSLRHLQTTLIIQRSLQTNEMFRKVEGINKKYSVKGRRSNSNGRESVWDVSEFYTNGTPFVRIKGEVTWKIGP